MSIFGLQVHQVPRRCVIPTWAKNPLHRQSCNHVFLLNTSPSNPANNPACQAEARVTRTPLLLCRHAHLKPTHNLRHNLVNLHHGQLSLKISNPCLSMSAPHPARSSTHMLSCASPCPSAKRQHSSLHLPQLVFVRLQPSLGPELLCVVTP